MNDEPLPERLRDESANSDHAGGTRALFAEAADELERLTRPLTREGVRALHADLGELAGHLTPAGGRDWRAVALMARDELVRLAGECERLEQLASPARMLAPGTSAKVAERLAAGLPEPTSARRFVAYYREGWAWPAGGSFVQAGPVGSTWRVLAVAAVEPGDDGAPVLTDPDGGTRRAVRLELEPVDPHDVPMTARVDVVPVPVDEATS